MAGGSSYSQADDAIEIRVVDGAEDQRGGCPDLFDTDADEGETHLVRSGIVQVHPGLPLYPLERRDQPCVGFAHVITILHPL